MVDVKILRDPETDGCQKTIMEERRPLELIKNNVQVTNRILHKESQWIQIKPMFSSNIFLGGLRWKMTNCQCAELLLQYSK